MAVTDPADINAQFAAAFNARDLAGLEALFADDARVVDPDGNVQHGRDGVRRHLTALLEVPGSMRSVNQSAIPIDDLVVLTARWEIAHGGAPIAAATSAEIVRRQPGGTWRYIFDQPFACAHSVARTSD